MKNVEWIIYTMDCQEYIKFMTNLMEDYELLPYKQFYDYIHKFKCKDRKQLSESLNKLGIVFLLDCREETISKIPYSKVASRNDLLNLNSKKKEIPTTSEQFKILLESRPKNKSF